MDNDLANIIRNNIPNDYCKRLCLDVMEGEQKNNNLSDFTDEKIMIYCLIYGDSYFVNRIYKEKNFDKISSFTINFRYIYLYNSISVFFTKKLLILTSIFLNYLFSNNQSITLIFLIPL